MPGIKIAVLFLYMVISTQGNAQDWKVYEDSAKISLDQNSFKDAINFYSLAKQKYSITSAAVDSNFIRISTALGAVYETTEDFTSALREYSELLAYVKERSGQNNLDYVNTAFRLAGVHFSLAEYVLAEKLLLDCIAIIQGIKGDNRLLYAEICNTLAILYRNIAAFDKSEKFYLETLRILDELGDQEIPYAVTINNLGVMYRFTAQYEKSEAALLKAKERKEKLFGIKHKEYALTLSTLGLLYKDIGRYNGAERLLLEAVDILAKYYSKNIYQYAVTIFNLSDLYRLTGKYDKAEPLLFEAKRVQEGIFKGDHPNISMIINNIGLVYFELGQFNKAIDYLEQAKAMMKRIYGEKHHEYARTGRNLAMAYVYSEKPGEARELIREVFAIHKQAAGTDTTDLVALNNLLFNLYMRERNYNDAETLGLGNRAIAGSGLGESHRLTAVTSHNLGSLYKEKNELDKAELYYRQAFDILLNVTGDNHYLFTMVANDLGSLFWQKSDLTKADSFFVVMDKSVKAQLRQLFAFQNELEKHHFLNLVGDNSDNFYSFYFQEDIPTINGSNLLMSHSLENRSRLLQSLTNLKETIIHSGDSLLQHDYTQWVNTREQLSFWLVKPISERKGRDKILKERADSIEKKLIRSAETFKKFRSGNDIDLSTIREKLKPGEAAVEFTQFRYHNGRRWTDSTYYIALVLRKDRATTELVKLFEEGELRRILKYNAPSAGQHLVNFFYSGQPTADKSKNLSEIIWKPLEDKLSGISTVYFAPAGLLHKISFSSLPLSPTEVLSDKVKLVQLNSTGSLIDRAEYSITTSDKIDVFGGVYYDADSTSISTAARNYTNKVACISLPADLSRSGIPEFQYLTGTSKEVITITNMGKQRKYNVTNYSGLKATEEALKSQSGINSPAILHIATHGFFFPDPQNKLKKTGLDGASIFRQSDDPLIRSGLALAGANNTWKGKPVAGVEDGILTAYEVSNMYLPNTKLAVLSACETGLGDIHGSEGVYGLQRAFKMAGVENLVMSLWKVPDAETAEFMQEFYKNIFTKQKISDAFYNAQTLMRNKYRKEPFKWAAWVLIR